MYQPGTEAVPSFKLVKRLGRGAFGEVWLAAAPGGTRVALKIIRLDTKGEREFSALRLVKQIRHPNLMPIIAFWLKDEDGNIIDETESGPLLGPVVDGSEPLNSTAIAPLKVQPTVAYRAPAELIVAMGLGDQSLYDRLLECQRQGLVGIPIDELLHYMDGAAQAIDHLNSPIHESGHGPVSIQHRDEKPQNILIVGGAAQVCDYGLARTLDDVRHTSSLSAAYAAPECFAGNVSAQSDQYALAMSYFELRTGELPFSDTSLMAVVTQKRDGTLELSKLKGREREVIRRATSVSPADRFPNCRAMVGELRAAVRDERAWTPSLKQIAIATFLTLLLVGGLWRYFWHPAAFCPPGTQPDEDAQVVEVGGNRYYDRILWTAPDGTRVRLLLIPATPGDELRTFYIMENKVSNRLFEQFAKERPAALSPNSRWREGPAVNGKSAGMKNIDWPVVLITAQEASNFAQWMGGRLPSSKQWVKAAGLGRAEKAAGPYREPWDPRSNTEIAINRSLQGPLPVGTASHDISPTGCRDMAGNGYEWTRSLVAPRDGYVPREFPDVQPDDMVLLRSQSYIIDEPVRYDALEDPSADQMEIPDRPRFDISFRVVIDALP
jgi:serine/threonine protein kinase